MKDLPIDKLYVSSSMFKTRENKVTKGQTHK